MKNITKAVRYRVQSLRFIYVYFYIFLKVFYMDPFTLSVITGIIATCLYSSVLRIADEIIDIPLSAKNIIDRLTKNEANFASIIEITFQNISPVIKPEKFYNFLKSNEGIEIVERIYLYDLSDEGELNNLEKVKKDFCERVTLYFGDNNEMLTAAPKLFLLLVKCCQESLDVMIKEKGFSAFDDKIKVYFKILDERLDKYQKQLHEKVETNNKLITQILVNTDKIANNLTSSRYETFGNAYISPNEVFGRVDLEHFVGRIWLLEIVDSFLLNNDRGYFILEAEAGFGKTAFLAWLVRERGYIHNFCELTPGLNKIGDGLKNLASQLALAYNLIDEGMLPNDAASRPDYLYDMLKKAAEKRSNDEKIVLVIDALDQAGTFKGQNVLGLPKSLPEGVFIIASQQPVGVILNVDKAVTPRDVCRLSDYKEKNEDDIRLFLYDATTRPKISAFLQNSDYTPDKFVTILMEKCQGVWVYLHFVIPEIESNKLLASDLDSLPVGLRDYYIEYWARWREDDQWQWCENYLPLLSILAVVQEPVSIERLALWISSKMPVRMLRRLLKEQWRPYIIVSLHGKEERYRFYHQSLQELFNGRVEQKNLSAADEAFLDELKGATLETHNCLIERYLTAWGGLNDGLPWLQNPENLTIDDGYGLRYLAFHLEASGRIVELHRLLALETTKKRNAWFEAKDAYDAVSNYMVDVARAWNLSEKESEHQIEQGSKAFSIGLEIRYALVYTSINSLSASIPVKLLVAFLETKKWTEAKVFMYAQKEPDPYNRAIKLISVYQKTKYESIKRDAFRKALDAASTIHNYFDRAQVLSALFHNLDGQIKEEMMEIALDAASEIQDDYQRALAFSHIVHNSDGQIKEEVFKKTLDAVSKIHDDYQREQAFLALFHNLDGQIKEEVIEKALEIASNLQDDYYRGSALSALVPHLDGQIKEEVIEKTLDAASKIRYINDWREQVLLALFSNLNGQIKVSSSN